MMDLMFLCLMCVCAGEVSQALRSSPLHPSDGLCRYGWTQNCCWGWTRNSQGRCTPVCESGCKHGECVGPDQCRCHAGFTGKTCNQDVNECAFRPCKFRCMNTLGSYKCYCLNGFMMMADGTCKNTRTCAMANCQYSCAVMKGQVTCQCPSPGLRLSPDGRTCVDADECVTGQAKCPRFRKCVNTFGSYICRCHDGFELKHINGKYHCTDKKNLFICYEKPGHKKCKCKASVDGKGYDCKTVVTKVTIEPAGPVKVTLNPTTPSTTTGAMTTTSPKTTTRTFPFSTTTINPTTAVTMTTAPPTTTVTSATVAVTTAPPTTTVTSVTVAVTTAPPTTTVTSATVAVTTAPPTTTVTSVTVAMTTAAPTTTVTSATVAMTTAPPTTTVTSETVAMTTAAAKTTTLTTTVADTTHSPTETSPATTITMATTAVPVATTSMTTAGSTTTLDNRIHRDTPKPRGDVHIPRYEHNLFDWDFDVELGNTAEYTHDDPGAGAVSCTFDKGLCVWMSDSGDLHWNIKEDPAGGRYMTVPDATSRRSIRGARFTLPLAPPMKAWRSNQLCLSFRHRLHGHHIGSLQVFVRKGRSHSPSVWTSTGGHGWKHTRITLWGRGLDDIVLKGERRRGKHGEIAVDDLSLSRGACAAD